MPLLLADFLQEDPIVDRNPTDVLKLDILAPGHSIWAAWSPMSVRDPILSGYNFGLLSGTSMATPHVAGITALIKQHNPSWTPSMIASAMSTTATKHDNNGEPIMAQGAALDSLYLSTPFDFGGGLVSATHAIDPGLVLLSGFEDYMSFLCSLPNISPAIIKTATGGSCVHPFLNSSDLNIHSMTITALVGSRLVRRSLTNVAGKVETYLCAVLPPKRVSSVGGQPHHSCMSFKLKAVMKQCLMLNISVYAGRWYTSVVQGITLRVEAGAGF